MEKYLGVKLIEAEPLSGTKTAENGDLLLQEGYKVIYEDGYTSWSPKDVFEKAYKQIATEIIIPNKDLEAHQYRVIDEAKELDYNINKLDSFIESNEIFKTLSQEEQHLLIKQVQAMSYYFTILTERIKNF